MQELLEGKHSRMGASGVKRLINCAASFHLSKLIPKEETSQSAAQGTLAHHLAECKLKEMLAHLAGDKRAFRFNIGNNVGMEYKVGKHTFTITQEMVNAVNVYVEFIQETMTTYGLDHTDVFVEKTVKIDNPFNDDMWGQLDCMILVPFTMLQVIDYKHGSGIDVDVVENEQLMYYALAVYLSLEPWQRETIPVIEIVIVQPNIGGEDGGIKRWSFSVEDLMVFHGRLMDMIDLIEVAGSDPLEFLNPSDSWCRFCPAKPICPARRAQLQEKMGLNFFDMESFEDVKEMTPERIAQILPNVKEANDWFYSVASLALRLRENGIKIPGYTLKEKLADRAWVNQEEAEQYFAPLLGKKIWVEQKPKFMTPTQVEAELKDRKKRMDADDPLMRLVKTPLYVLTPEQLEKFEEPPAQLVKRDKTGYTLVQGEDEVEPVSTWAEFARRLQ